MQYGMELNTYKREKPYSGKKKREEYFNIKEVMGYLLAAFLISRVVMANYMSTFGIAFVLAVALNKEEIILLASGFGSIIGYITMINKIENAPIYMVSIGIILLCTCFADKYSKRKKEIAFFIFFLLENGAFNHIIRGLSTHQNAFQSILDVGCLLPLYYIIDYSVLCSKEIKTKHIFSNEEIISMIIAISLILCGTSEVKFGSVSIMNIICITFVMICSYINGSGVGSAIGITIGFIVGITSGSLLFSMSLYGIISLIIGIFSESGKWISIASYIVVFIILKLYSDIGSYCNVIEIFISAGIFLSIPEKTYKSLKLEFNHERKSEKVNEDYSYTIKNMMSNKLMEFSDLLSNMSSTVKNLADNNKILLNGKNNALIDNLAERTCSNCSMKLICWNRELKYTYKAFADLIHNYEENNSNMPEELQKKCIKRTKLINNADEIVKDHILKEMWRQRLIEGRQVMSGHLSSMSQVINDLVDNFSFNIIFDSKVEKAIRKTFDQKGIDYSSVLSFVDKHKRKNVRISIKSIEYNEDFIVNILQTVNDVLGTSMSINESKCVKQGDDIVIDFIETPKYHFTSYVCSECKTGEIHCGDSYSYNNLNDGEYMVVISDGMGSGPEAKEESQALVDLVEKFAKAGYSENAAVEAINSIMSMKFFEEEKFSTLDMLKANLYSGELKLIKIGAASSYVKSNNRIYELNSKSLPIGVLDKLDFDTVEINVKEGDVIVMISDGILECGGSFNMEAWIKDYLLKSSEDIPKTISENIISKVKEVSGSALKDDMTVIVSKVYALY
ncbi:stage II sporulation protein E [Clostridium sp. 19966]|uniref:stage II sporulation protein E n=1 Tax=Clostridium sp. 19966 TaxID=2768166 RepID=UPI0028DD4A43|nr:stage II sporulation protein E [Clostridium sp. 19966]MDT8715751.1 stage II sporulation protein E [Clostridium sp. 19966]